jgi:hypothetical protein
MNRSKLPILLVLLLALLAAGFTRHWAAVARTRGTAPAVAHAGGAAGLSRMNSYALALLLGGLRGPLVMFLWPSSEEQKQEKNLEDFDTKIEWIRLLQAEFDTVHIFQIWNKAYNISVQMANLGNKYRTILDALEYAHNVDAERPNNINILTAIGQIYGEKLGNSAEKAYYRERLREESMARQDLVRVTLPADRRAELSELAIANGVSPRKLQFTTDDKSGAVSVTLPKPVVEAIRRKLEGPNVTFVDRPRLRQNRNDPAWRRTELDPLLDASGKILPEHASELQHLKPYEPFRYGVSPLALGYNYYKRSQVLQNVHNQKHAQLSELVVDSRPALGLKAWSEEEWERGRRAELEAFGQQVPTERVQMETPLADLKLDAAPVAQPPLDEAIYSYDRCALLTRDSIKEYRRHLEADKTNVTTYTSHIDGLLAQEALVSGDRDYLLALRAGPGSAERQNLVKSAAEHYRQSIHRNQLILLQYYVDDELVKRFYPSGLTKANIVEKNLSAEQVNQLYAAIRAAVPRQIDQYAYGEEFLEFSSYIHRAQSRLKNLGQ